MRKCIIRIDCSYEVILIEWRIPWCGFHCSFFYLEMEKHMNIKTAGLVSGSFRWIEYSSSHMQVQGHKYKRCVSGFVLTSWKKPWIYLQDIFQRYSVFHYSGLYPFKKNLVQEYISWILFQRKTFSPVIFLKCINREFSQCLMLWLPKLVKASWTYFILSPGLLYGYIESWLFI